MSNQGQADYWGWLNVAKTQALELASKAQELASEAGKVAHDKAMEIAKQAQNYDLEVATTMFMGATPPATLTKDRPIESIKITKADLYKLDMVYVTENLISMGFPRDMNTQKVIRDGDDISEGNDINIVAAYLRKRHNGRFMIWNISEESYDYTKFCDQVLEYKFPGHPAPPLGLLFKICTSVESWLDADDKNVAAVHCLTGKGRTATLMACILTWLGEFESPMQALQYVAQRKNTAVDYLTIPSQRRYIQYFSNLLDGVKPSSEPLLLRRVIINSVPVFGIAPNGHKGCCPYVQLFKNGKLVASAAIDQEHSFQDDDNGISALEAAGQSRQLQLKWVSSEEGSASFTLDCLVQGDILLRCRHAAQSGARVSMFRAAFHTGYISGGVLRLTKAQCDGSSSDARFADDFFIDLIFASASETPSKIIQEAAVSDKYESSLHKDTRFWESIAARKNKSKKRKARRFEENQQDPFSIADESKFFIDQDDKNAIEVDFTGGSSSSFGKLSLNSQPKSYIDEDLMKQLAQFDEAESASSGEMVSPAPGSSGNVTVTGIEATSDTNGMSATDVGDDYLLLGSKAPSASLSQPSANTENISAPSTPARNSSTGKDLMALEELERELGLSDLQLFGNDKSTPTASSHSAPATTKKFTTPATGTKSGGDIFDDVDELDELEKYLESLSAPK